MYACDTLAGDNNGYLGKQYVVIDKCGTVAYLDKDIIGEHSALCGSPAFGTEVVMHKVLSDTCTLCFPVKPYTHDTVVDVISPDGNVYSSMELDTCGLSASQLL